MDEAYLIAQKALIAAIQTEVYGMLAENTIRLSRGESLAYPEESFKEKAEELRSIHQMIMENR